MLDFGNSNSKSEVSKSNSWKNYFFLKNKTTLLQREPFITMFYTIIINLSPLLVTNKGVMLINILSNYQIVSIPLTQRK